MDPRTVMPKDSALILKAATATQVTSTASIPATSTVGGAGDLEFGQLAANAWHFAPGQGGMPMLCNIEMVSYDLTTGDETYTFKVQTSADGTNWKDASATKSVGYGGADLQGTAAAMAAAGGLIVIPFFADARFVKLVATLGGTTPILVCNDIWLSPRANA